MVALDIDVEQRGLALLEQSVRPPPTPRLKPVRRTCEFPQLVLPPCGLDCGSRAIGDLVLAVPCTETNSEAVREQQSEGVAWGAPFSASPLLASVLQQLRNQHVA
eukprot:TRINITY_DN76636_c0_g1_i1.p3 TRINITY_DN76636_c0_g1~~TRINITY_DN76636_c0_g1_i1.p3  ORF type:complete len:105 (+),score=18.78 TRINITY_DN76636_c0_g1_i1:93-407(+)